MTTNAEPARVFVDTNVLLGAIDDTRTCHQAALDVWEDDPRRLVVSDQVAREFLASATRPVEANGLGMTGPQAVSSLRTLLEGVEVLPPTASTLARLQDLVSAGAAAGKQVHDASLVASALAHGIAVLMTDNVRHFARFADLIEIESLA